MSQDLTHLVQNSADITYGRVFNYIFIQLQYNLNAKDQAQRELIK